MSVGFWQAGLIRMKKLHKPGKSGKKYKSPIPNLHFWCGADISVEPVYIVRTAKKMAKDSPRMPACVMDVEKYGPCQFDSFPIRKNNWTNDVPWKAFWEFTDTLHKSKNMVCPKGSEDWSTPPVEREVTAEFDPSTLTYPDLELTGVLDKKTISALQRFLNHKNLLDKPLEVNGVLNDRTQLGLQTYLSVQGGIDLELNGFLGWSSVKGLQEFLNKFWEGAGWMKSTLWQDGVWDAKTIRALQGFLNTNILECQ